MIEKVYPTVHCLWCGSVDLASYMDDVIEAMVQLKACFSCYHWLSNAQADSWEEPLAVIAGHSHFRIRPEDYRFKGHGGHRFVIKFFDGRVITTTNLWSQGDIPEHFWELMPDNANFVEGWGKASN